MGTSAVWRVQHAGRVELHRRDLLVLTPQLPAIVVKDLAGDEV